MDEAEDILPQENQRPAATAARVCPTKKLTNTCWYLAPPACFTRSAPSPSTNPLENLLIEHPSMSVYLLPLAASSSRRAALYRSAPPLIMEENLLGRTSSRGSPARPPLANTGNSGTPSTPAALTTATTPVTAAVARQKAAVHTNRKRRLRAQRHAGTLPQAQQPPTPEAVVPAAPVAPRAEDYAVAEARQEEKLRVYAEKEELLTGRRLLAKNQLQRTNGLPEVAGPKKRGSRDGNYRCLHWGDERRDGRIQRTRDDEPNSTNFNPRTRHGTLYTLSSHFALTDFGLWPF